MEAKMLTRHNTNLTDLAYEVFRQHIADLLAVAGPHPIRVNDLHTHVSQLAIGPAALDTHTALCELRDQGLITLDFEHGALVAIPCG
jgi:hypothetical protein